MISESDLAQFLSFFFNNPERQSEQVLGSNAISKLAVLVCQIVMLLVFEKHDKQCFSRLWKFTDVQLMLFSRFAFSGVYYVHLIIVEFPLQAVY